MVDELLLWITPLSTEQHGDIVQSMFVTLIEYNYLDQAIRVLELFENLRDAERAVLIEAMILNENFAQAIQIADGISNSQEYASATEAIAIAWIEQTGNAEQAIAFYESTEQFLGWPRLAVAIANQGSIERARTILDLSFDQVKAAINSIPDETTRNIKWKLFIHNVALAQDFERAVALIERLPDSDRPVGIRSLAIGFALGEEYGRMMDVLDDYADSLKPRQMELVSIVDSLARRQAFDQAITLLSRIEDDRIRLQVISNIAFELVQGGESDRAMMLVPEIGDLQIGGVEAFRQNPFIWSSLQGFIYALADQGEFDYAFQVVEVMDEPFTIALTKMTLAGKMIEAGYSETASLTLNQVLYEIGIEK